MSDLYTSMNAGLLVLIWLIQIIVYPGMHGWDHTRFAELHRDYYRRIGLIVGPLMVAQAVLAVRQLLVVSDIAAVVQALLITMVWATTALVSMPLHRLLKAGYDGRTVDRLVTTNWLRTSSWSLVSLLDWFG